MLNSFREEPTIRWLYLDLNSFFASVEQQENPYLQGKPVAIVPSLTDSTCAIAASYEAKKYGIKTGTKIFEAKRLCPNLICIQGRHNVYVDYHHRIFDEIENHLHIEKICSIDEVACRLTGDETQESNAITLAKHLKAIIRDKIGPALTCSIGIAQTPLLAKIAAEMQKPDGLTLFSPDNYTEKLFSLDLLDLPGININMRRRLFNAGIYSVEQLYNTAPKHARKIWRSVAGERYWYLIHGYNIPETQTQKSVIGHSRVLDPNLRSPEKAHIITRQLLTKAASRLRRYNLYTKRLSLSVRHPRKYSAKWKTECQFPATDNNFILLQHLEKMWKNMMLHFTPETLLKVGVSLSSLCEKEQITLDMFEDNSPQKPQKTKTLSPLLDQINARYGKGTISIGTTSTTQAGFVGTKIAFSRVPDLEEFQE